MANSKKRPKIKIVKDYHPIAESVRKRIMFLSEENENYTAELADAIYFLVNEEIQLYKLFKEKL